MVMGHTIHSYGGTLFVVMGAHYSWLWGYTIHGYEVTLFTVMGAHY